MECQNLLLVLWALPELKLKDKELTKIIIRDYICADISVIPTSLIPLALSVLWGLEQENKRAFKKLLK